jgi:hypothetical protein
MSLGNNTLCRRAVLDRVLIIVIPSDEGMEAWGSAVGGKWRKEEGEETRRGISGRPDSYLVPGVALHNHSTYS